MREPKCDSCLNRRPVVSENGLHYCCSLSGTKPLYCMADGRHYKSIITADELASCEDLRNAVAKAVAEAARRKRDAEQND